LPDLRQAIRTEASRDSKNLSALGVSCQSASAGKARFQTLGRLLRSSSDEMSEPAVFMVQLGQLQFPDRFPPEELAWLAAHEPLWDPIVVSWAGDRWSIVQGHHRCSLAWSWGRTWIRALAA
jgi:hypothetical protein